MSDKKSFWSTLPGLATGTATVITAALSIFGVVKATDNDSKDQDQPSSSASRETGGSSDSGAQGNEPRARVAPDTLDFGNQGLTGSSPKMIVTLTNLGSEDLSVETADLSGADASAFKIVDNACEDETLAPKSDCEIEVQFSPKSVGDAKATLNIEHNAPDSPSEASLTGKGVVLRF